MSASFVYRAETSFLPVCVFSVKWSAGLTTP